VRFLAYCVLPEKKLCGNYLYRYKYVRDFDGGMGGYKLWGDVRKNIITDSFSTKTAISARI